MCLKAEILDLKKLFFNSKYNWKSVEFSINTYLVPLELVKVIDTNFGSVEKDGFLILQLHGTTSAIYFSSLEQRKNTS